MNFVKHSDLVGRHAYLSPSGYHWIRYSEDKMAESYLNFLAIENGTKLHDFAAKCIEYRERLDDVPKTLNMYVNDSIEHKMTPEQPLYFSDNCFGTCDAISFRKKELRIHDLKTGSAKASLDQLRIYAALFCLEYKVKPFDISMLLRIYQNDEIIEEYADPEVIFDIMQIIKKMDKVIESLKIKE